ncbi:uncharacterized protein LOC131874904 [Cryptomeria japonica]|uniref:uncharacterized protein LOC131874904 n=1 Tax=Cryptomeria japonica TaxID=3369 RepID=UPI0027DA9F55|nr:uncharacterized protein LOC131874904 [Cryptomeria japonica]
MRLTSWNVRGLSAPDKKCLVKRTLAKLDSKVFVLQETKLNKDKVLEFIKYCYKWEGIFKDARGSTRGLGIMWNASKVDVHPIASFDHWMACIIVCKQSNISYPLFNIYGPSRMKKKLKVWNEVFNQASQLDSGKVIADVDFNAHLDINEKVGGLRKPTKVMEDFWEFVSNCKLVDILPKNGRFTWINRRLNFANISERHDRFLVGEWWINGDYSLESEIVPQVGLDHLPLSLSIAQEMRNQKNYFIFQIMWWRDEAFLDNLKIWWQEGNIYSSSPSFKFTKRIQYLKNRIKDWNKNSFKNIFAEKSRIEKKLEEISSKVMQFGMTNEEFELEKELKTQYLEILKREELYWKDKSRELCIFEGDLNTKCFHASSKARRINNRICSIKDKNGKLKNSDTELERIALEYFEEIMGSSKEGNSGTPSIIEEVIDPPISSSDSDMLVAPYSLEEIKKVTFALHPHKAPGPDGITTKLFQKGWEFMQKDIWTMVEEFRKKHKFVKEMNHTR